jgi:hypothetical protein
MSGLIGFGDTQTTLITLPVFKIADNNRLDPRRQNSSDGLA